MAIRPALKQGDVTKAVKGAKSAGLLVARVEVDMDLGRITIFAGEPASASMPSDPYADWKTKRDARRA
jgi:hypothetical protein